VFSSFEMTKKYCQTLPLPIHSFAPPSLVETCHGNLSLLSSDHCLNDRLTCLRLLMQRNPHLHFARAIRGSMNRARTNTIDKIPSTSSNVKPLCVRCLFIR